MRYHRHVLSVWSPHKLANANRSVLSWWDASLPLTISTGVVNEPDQRAGLDFAQSTASMQPILSGSKASSIITYDGSNDNLKQPVTTGDFQNLTYFEYWCVVFLDSVNVIIPLSFADEGGSANNRIHYGGTSANALTFTNNDNSATTVVLTSTNTFSNGNHVAGYIGDGSSFTLFVDDTSEALTGTNNGKGAPGNLTNKTLIDIVSVGAILHGGSGPSHSPNIEKFGLAIGGTSSAAATTSAERTSIFKYMNNKFALGL